MSRRWTLVGWLVSACCAGCASNPYVYRPAEQATATVGDLPAGRYAIPPERPLGTVLVASSGVAELKFQNDAKTRMLSVRMVVANNADDFAWKVDTRAQRIVVPGGGESAPAYVNTDGQGLPVIEVARGQKRTLDLFYPLPANAKGAKQVPEFDFVWQVQTGERVVAERTPFDRLELEPVFVTPYYYGWGFGPSWWYDPFWPGPSYTFGPPFRYYGYPAPVHVAPVPVRPGP